MRQTKKIALSAMMCALGVAFISLGAVVQVLDLTVAALCSLLVVFVYIEIGAPYVHLVWLCTSLLSFIIFPGSVIWLEYFLVFGFFPILKAYIERLPRGVWLLLKLLYANATFALLFYLQELIFEIPLITEETVFGISGIPLLIAAFVIMNIAFIAYDMLITVMLRIYLFKYRERFKKLLK